MGLTDEAPPGPPGLEIERRWLLDRMPSAAELDDLGATPVEIEQVYLAGTGVEAARRVRRVSDGGDERFVLTIKRGSGITREETSSALDGVAYARLVAGEADPARHPIRKTRHLVPHGRHLIELDEFREPPGVVMLEVELAAPDEAIDPWPAAIARRIVREVTDEPGYQNAMLALRP